MNVSELSDLKLAQELVLHEQDLQKVAQGLSVLKMELQRRLQAEAEKAAKEAEPKPE